MVKNINKAVWERRDAKDFCYSSEFLQLVIKEVLVCCALLHLGSCVTYGNEQLKSKKVLSYPYDVHVFHPPALLGILAVVKETLVVDGTFSKKDKEILASFIAMTNGCTHCMHMHMLVAEAEGADSSTLHQAIRAKDPLVLSDRKLGRIVEWWMAAQTRGVPGVTWVPFLTQEQCAELVSVTFLSNFTSRIAGIFTSWREFCSKELTFFAGFKQVIQKTKGRMSSACIGEMPEKINYLQYAEDPLMLMDQFSDLPGDFCWVGENKAMATAYAYWVWSMNEMAAAYIPPNAKEFVKKYISENFNGTDTQLSRTWAFSVTENLKGTQTEKFGATFMLLLAFAQSDIDGAIMKILKKHYPNYRARRALVLWSAFQTARTIAWWQNKKLQSK